MLPSVFRPFWWGSPRLGTHSKSPWHSAFFWHLAPWVLWTCRQTSAAQDAGRTVPLHPIWGTIVGAAVLRFVKRTVSSSISRRCSCSPASGSWCRCLNCWLPTRAPQCRCSQPAPLRNHHSYLETPLCFPSSSPDAQHYSFSIMLRWLGP